MEGRKERGGWKVVSSSHEGANLPFVCGNFAAFRPTPLAPPSPSRGKLNPAERRGGEGRGGSSLFERWNNRD